MINKFDIFKDAVNNCFQVRSKTNSYSLEFDDIEKENIFIEIVALINNDDSILLSAIKNNLKKKYPEEKILDVLHSLNDYGLIPISLNIELNSEKNSESNSKQIQSPSQNFTIKKLEDQTLGIIGDSQVSEFLFLRSKDLHFKKIIIKKYSELDEISQIESLFNSSDLVIVDGNKWSPYHTEQINICALKLNKPWLYIGGVEEATFKIGPLFYGKDTGCYDCLISRIKSNHEYPTFLNSYESYLRNSKQSSKQDIIPHPEITYNLIVDLVLLEVIKFFEEWAMPVSWKTYISFDIITLNVSKHTLLKKPYCLTCKPKLEFNPAPWLEAITLK